MGEVFWNFPHWPALASIHLNRCIVDTGEGSLTAIPASAREAYESRNLRTQTEGGVISILLVTIVVIISIFTTAL